MRTVPFEGTTIPVLHCDALMVFKAMFNRTRDWADIEDMVAAGADTTAAIATVSALLGEDDAVVTRPSTIGRSPNE